MSEPIKIEILGPMSQDEMRALTSSKEFNAPFDQYIEDVYERFTTHLTDSEKEEVAVWNRGRVPSDFWDNVSKPAYNSIMTLISWGLG